MPTWVWNLYDSTYSPSLRGYFVRSHIFFIVFNSSFRRSHPTTLLNNFFFLRIKVQFFKHSKSKFNLEYLGSINLFFDSIFVWF